MTYRSVISAVILAASTSFSQAADDIQTPIEDAGFGWAGTYAGAFVSYSHSDFDWVEGNGAGTFDGSINSWGGGGFIGHNIQNGGTVFGIEADGEFLTGTGNFAGVPGPGLVNASVDWTASIRGRLGKDMGQYLPYLLAGVTWASLDVTAVAFPPSQSATHMGYVVGAGVDMKVGDNGGFARLEYNYSDYQDEGYLFCPVICAADIGLTSHSVRLGIGKIF